MDPMYFSVHSTEKRNEIPMKHFSVRKNDEIINLEDSY